MRLLDRVNRKLPGKKGTKLVVFDLDSVKDVYLVYTRDGDDIAEGDEVVIKAHKINDSLYFADLVEKQE